MIAAGKSTTFLDTLANLKITIDQDGVSEIFGEVHRLAIIHGLSSYDASYLELALRRNLPLATLDDQLIRACRMLNHPLL